MSRAQVSDVDHQRVVFCCYVEAEDPLSLRVASSAWRQSVDEDKVWLQLCLHDLLHTRLDFAKLVVFISHHRLFYWQARYLKEDGSWSPWDFGSRLRNWPWPGEYPFLLGEDWLHVEIYTFNAGGNVSLRTAVLPELARIAATFPNEMMVPVGGHFHVADGQPFFLRIVATVGGMIGPVCDTCYEFVTLLPHHILRRQYFSHSYYFS